MPTAPSTMPTAGSQSMTCASKRRRERRCGGRFMAETAKILSPEKIVILPDMDAGCSLEDSCPPDQFKAFREAHPDHIALTYINCSAAVKALSDIIVTSSSAQIILDQIPK